MKATKFLTGAASLHKAFNSIAAALVLFVPAASCNSLLSGIGDEADGRIWIDFASSTRSILTRAGTDVPDTEDFILKVSNASGTVIYEGRFGDSPENFEVSPGSYTVSARSADFTAPCFDCPQFGDTRIVSVASGQDVSVTLECTMTNSGLRLVFDPTFRTAWPQGTVYLKSNDGTLMYGYTEKRTAYFNPGSVKLTVDDGEEQVLTTRTLQEKQIVTLTLCASEDLTRGTGVQIQVDTTREYLSESFTAGGSGATDTESAYSVTEARSHVGETGAWVCGYIVGECYGSKSYDFEAPFTKGTNILLGLRSGTDDAQYCISVELTSGSKARETLNLVSNPSMLGRHVYLKGNIEASYFGIPGLKSVTEFVVK